MVGIWNGGFYGVKVQIANRHLAYFMWDEADTRAECYINRHESRGPKSEPLQGDGE